MAVDAVEPALAQLWAAVPARAAARTRTVTLVAVCAVPERAEHMARTLRRVMTRHPGRALLVVLRPEGPSAIAATEVTLEDSASPSEFVVLEARGDARAWVPATVERLLLAGARVALWWPGGLPTHDALYDGLSALANLVAVDSAELDLRDLVALERLAQAARERYVLADLTWVRLRAWQELLARFFDDPAVLAKLDDARELTVSCSPHRVGVDAEPTSTVAGLFAGWFAHVVGADAARARWEAAAGACRRVVLPRVGHRDLTLRFDTTARADVSAGAMLRVDLATADGSHFQIVRDEDPLVLGWLGNCAGAVIPHAVIRLALAEDSLLLAGHLDRPVRDPLYESTLAATARMMAPLFATTANPRGPA